MYPGWLSLGQGDPYNPANEQYEIVNNARALTYAANAGICWLQDCNDCPDAILPGWPYVSPGIDGAPWYDVNNPDTWGFLGVLGMQITGDESSTRNTQVTNAITGGGVIGPAYFSFRTLTLRAIAIATDECALQAGLDWLNHQCDEMVDTCLGDRLTFFDCCPCMCPDYDPATPDVGEDCLAECVHPYLRYYNHVAVTAGPNVIRHPSLYSRGAMIELELILVAADPVKYHMPLPVAQMIAVGTTPISDPPPPLPGPADPFDIPGVTMASIAQLLTRPRPAFDALPTDWLRDEAPWPADRDIEPRHLYPTLQIDAEQNAATVRIGMWCDGELLGGFVVPFIPAGTTLIIDGHTREVEAIRNGNTRTLTGFVKRYDGRPVLWPRLPNCNVVVTVDQEVGKAVPLTVSSGVVGSDQ